jgi:hypothetical protein
VDKRHRFADLCGLKLPFGIPSATIRITATPSETSLVLVMSIAMQETLDDKLAVAGESDGMENNRKFVKNRWMYNARLTRT